MEPSKPFALRDASKSEAPPPAELGTWMLDEGEGRESVCIGGVDDPF